MWILISIYVVIHSIVAAFFCIYTDPFGLTIFALAVPAAAAATVSALSGLFQFWRDKRRGQLHILLLGTLLVFQEIAARQLYGYRWFEWLPAYFPLLALQYFCCLFTLQLLRSLIDKL